MYLPYYDGLCGVLSDHWQPISGIRSFDEQLALYLQGRGSPGAIVTNSKPGLSYHNYGLASDWNWFEDEHYAPLSSDDPRWKEYTDACEKVGVRCLAFERPHNEYPWVGSPRAISNTFAKGGQAAVESLLRGGTPVA